MREPQIFMPGVSVYVYSINSSVVVSGREPAGVRRAKQALQGETTQHVRVESCSVGKSLPALTAHEIQHWDPDSVNLKRGQRHRDGTELGGRGGPRLCCTPLMSARLWSRGEQRLEMNVVNQSHGALLWRKVTHTWCYRFSSSPLRGWMGRNGRTRQCTSAIMSAFMIESDLIWLKGNEAWIKSCVALMY